MISVEEAFQLVEQRVAALPRLQSETIPLNESVGRVLSRQIVSDVDSPPHDKSVMDGFAVLSSDIRDGLTSFRVLETIVAGTMPTQKITSGTTSRIMTGAPMPAGADAVMMVELSNIGYNDPTPQEVTLNWDGPVEEFTAGKHVMQRAQNFASGQAIYDAGHRIRAVDIGLLAEVGAAQVELTQKPTVGLLPTGDELVDCGSVPRESQIRNSNGPMLKANCRNLGAEVVDLGIAGDSEGDLTAKIKKGLEQDFLLLSGGVSAGTMDLVPGILESQGVAKVFHKVKVKPGKPIFFGVLERADGKPCLVFGLPGNPVSSLIGFHLFVSTAIRLMLGQTDCRPVGRPAVLSAPHQTRGDRPTYWPGRSSIGPDAAPGAVEPLRWNGSSDLFSLGAAEGLILMPAREEIWAAGEQVMYYPL
jgi:molybdopterin molybdotransferase